MKMRIQIGTAARVCLWRWTRSARANFLIAPYYFVFRQKYAGALQNAMSPLSSSHPNFHQAQQWNLFLNKYKNTPILSGCFLTAHCSLFIVGVEYSTQK